MGKNSNISDKDILKEETQPGVVVYRSNVPEGAGVFDMDIAPGIKEVTIKYDLLMLGCEKSFPDVEKLIIGEDVVSIEILNTLFPNVRWVLSMNYEFETGSYLVYNHFGFKTLLNAFCRGADEEIDLGDIDSIDNFAFKGCESLNIIGGEDIKDWQAIEQDAFSESALKSQPFKNGIKKAGHIIVDIDYTADEIDIPDDRLKKIVFSSDIDFSKIKKLIIHRPETVEQINYQCGFPDTLALNTDLLMHEQDVAGVAHFCTSKTYIKNFSVLSPEFKEIDGIAYTMNGKKLVACSMGKEHVIIPDGVKTIGKYAFANCHVKSVIIPDSVTEISESAFSSCSNLETVIFGKNVESIGDKAFGACVNLKSVTLPESIRLIGNYAFFRVGLKSVQLSEGLLKVGIGAFAETLIKSIELPASITDLTVNCFSDMVEKITIPSFRKDICVGCIKGFRPLPSNDTVMKLQCGDRYLYIPRYMKPSTINEGIDSIEAFFTNPEKKVPGIWSYAFTATCKQNMAFLEYVDFGSESAKEYLKKNAKKIALRLIADGEEEAAAKFIKTGIVSNVALKELLKKAEENDMPILKSYILQRLNDGEDTKQNFYI